MAAHSLAARLLANASEKKGHENFKFSVRWFMSRPRIATFPKGDKFLLSTDKICKSIHQKNRIQFMTITYLLDVYESAVLCKIKRHFLQYAFKALLAWRNNNFDILFFEACWFNIREFSECRACQSQVSFLVVIMNPSWWFMGTGHRRQGPKWGSWNLGVFSRTRL